MKSVPDLRQHAQQTKNRLLVGLIALVFVIGLGLIYLFYGIRAALLGFFCLIGLLIPIFLIVIILNLIERSLKNDR